MPRPSSSPTMCAATWRACRCGRTATRWLIARSSSCGGTRRRRRRAGPGPGAGGGRRRDHDRDWSWPAATATAPRTPSARPARRSISSSPASARSGCSTNRGFIRSARLCSRTRGGSTKIPRPARRRSTLRAELANGPRRVARITVEIGSTSEAVAQYQQAVALWETLVASQPGNRTYQENLARTLNELGGVLMLLNGRARRGPPHLPPRPRPDRAACRRRSRSRSHHA